MLMRLVAPIAAGLALGLSLVAVAVLLASPAYANGANDESVGVEDSSTVVTSTAVDGAVSVSVVGVGSTVEGGSFPIARTQGASAICWYGPGMTGPEYYEYWKDGGVAV